MIEKDVYGNSPAEYKLLLKQHWDTGLNYLCITRQDPLKYHGSGVYWSNHLTAHGKNIHTTVILYTDSKEELAKCATTWSTTFDIAKNEDWANLVPECGYEGNQGNLPYWVSQQSPEYLKQIHADDSKKSKATFKRKYGTEDVCSIARKAFADQTGFNNPMQDPNIAKKNRESCKRSLVEKYGVEHNMLIPGLAKEVADKRESSLQEKYGVKYPLQIPGKAEQAKLKREETNVID